MQSKVYIPPHKRLKPIYTKNNLPILTNITVPKKIVPPVISSNLIENKSINIPKKSDFSVSNKSSPKNHKQLTKPSPALLTAINKNNNHTNLFKELYLNKIEQLQTELINWEFHYRIYLESMFDSYIVNNFLFTYWDFVKIIYFCTDTFYNSNNFKSQRLFN